MIPVGIARAIKLAETHPAVRATRVEDGDDDREIVVEFDIATELPGSWRPAEESPLAVRAIEPVRFAFPRSYPLNAPKITLRRDFNRCHPHINPGSPDDPPNPCIIAGSPRELIQSRGIESLVDRMADWLDKASMVALNDPKQGWEPVRRDNIDDLMVIDGVSTRALADAAGGAASVQTSFAFLDDSAGGTYLIDHTSCVLKPFAEVRTHHRDADYRRARPPAASRTGLSNLPRHPAPLSRRRDRAPSALRSTRLISAPSSIAAWRRFSQQHQAGMGPQRSRTRQPQYPRRRLLQLTHTLTDKHLYRKTRSHALASSFRSTRCPRPARHGQGFKDLSANPEARTLDHPEWLGLLLDHEITLRRQKRFEARSRVARLRQPASVQDVDYRVARGLDRALFLKLAGCDWIRDKRNLIVTGPCKEKL